MAISASKPFRLHSPAVHRNARSAWIWRTKDTHRRRRPSKRASICHWWSNCRARMKNAQPQTNTTHACRRFVSISYAPHIDRANNGPYNQHWFHRICHVFFICLVYRECDTCAVRVHWSLFKSFFLFMLFDAWLEWLSLPFVGRTLQNGNVQGSKNRYESCRTIVMMKIALFSSAERVRVCGRHRFWILHCVCVKIYRVSVCLRSALLYVFNWHLLHGSCWPGSR